MTEEAQHGHEVDDLWAWIDQDDPAPDVPPIASDSVTAVMVVHDAAEWLPRQLLSLARLDPRPGLIVAVDTGSSDGSGELLERALAEGVIDRHLSADRQLSFGQAVMVGIDGSEPDWLWLLHDDSAPHRDALAQLLEGARQCDIVVPKLLEPKRRNYPETISEVGQAITMGGLRVPIVEPGDIDQRQSESRDVLGGSSAGMLVRGDTWREVGGIAPQVRRHRDGVDLGWRANAVGYRVLTWPDAALNHLMAGRVGLRPDDEHPHVSDRLAALRIAGSRGAGGVGLAVASVLRAAGFLLAKSPSYASAELRAWREYRSTREETTALAATLPEEDLTPEDLLPSRFWPVRHAVDALGSGLAERYRSLTEAPADTSIDELTSDEYAGPVRKRRFLSPTTLLVVVLVLCAALAARTLLGSGPVSGGGLLAPPPSLAEAWHAYLRGREPWLGLAAVASIVGFGSPAWFAFFAIILTPLLAALSSLALLRRLGVGVAAACAASAAWAGGTILLGLVTAGDVSGMVLAVIGPLCARALHSVLTNDAAGAERLRAPAGAAFWILIVACVWPVALPLLTVVGIVWVVRDRPRAVEAAVALVPAWVFLAPWLPALVRHPGRLLTGVDPLAWPDYPPASYALAVGRVLPSGLPLWVSIAFFVILAVVAVAALARLPRRVWVGCLVALAVPLVLGSVLSRVTVGVDGGVVRPLLSPWALLVLAAVLAPVLWQRAEEGRAAWLGPVAVSVSAALALGTWAVIGFAGPVRHATSVLPGYVRDVLDSERDSRALVISVGDHERVSWNVVDARQPMWGTGERNPIGSFDRQFTALAYSIAAADPPADLAQRFALMGVSHLYVGGVEADQRAALDNLEGLVSNPADDRSVVWTVSGLVSRLSIDAAEPYIVNGTIPAGGENRMLFLAESGGSDWSAKLDGRPLARAAATDRPLIDDSVVTFGPLPAGGGTVEVAPTEHTWRAWLHLLVMLSIGLLAAPTLGGTSSARRGL